MQIILTKLETQGSQAMGEKMQKLLSPLGVPAPAEDNVPLWDRLVDLSQVYPDNVRVDLNQGRVIFSLPEDQTMEVLDALQDYYQDMEGVLYVIVGLFKTLSNGFDRLTKRLKISF